MEDTKKTVLAGNGEKDVPRAVYDGVLTIDVDAQVESMEEQEPSIHSPVFQCPRAGPSESFWYDVHSKADAIWHPPVLPSFLHGNLRQSLRFLPITPLLVSPALPSY